MSRPVLAALVLLWVPVQAFAQAGERPAVVQQDAEAAYQTLVKDLQKALQANRADQIKKVQEAQAAGRPIPALSMVAPTGAFIAKAEELATQWQGKDEAILFLTFILKNASNENEKAAVDRAVQILATDHRSSDAIGEALPFLEMVAFRFRAVTAAIALLDSIIAENKHEACIAQALLSRGGLRLSMAKTAEDRSAATADFKRVATVTQDEGLLAQAKDALFEIENLQVGCTAPEIAAVDTDGVAFKLSDYRGKVILLDFWGFW